MRHSNRQLEREAEYAQLNKEYVSEKRTRLGDFKNDDKKKPRRSRFFCCLTIFMIMALCLGVIVYFISQIKDEAITDYFEKKEQLQQALPQARDELRTSLEQGGDLLEQTRDTVENAQDRFNQGKDLYEKAEDVYDRVEEVVN